MQFFAAGEGVSAPGLDSEGDHWCALCPLRDQRVALGSAHARYCVLDARPSQGYRVLRAWCAPGRDARRLEVLRHCAATGQFWALERWRRRQQQGRVEEAGANRNAVAGAEGDDGDEEVFELVRYAGVDGVDEEGPSAGRAAAVLDAPAATIGWVRGSTCRYNYGS